MDKQRLRALLMAVAGSGLGTPTNTEKILPKHPAKGKFLEG